jgi:hypothetical protein
MLFFLKMNSDNEAVIAFGTAHAVIRLARLCSIPMDDLLGFQLIHVGVPGCPTLRAVYFDWE